MCRTIGEERVGETPLACTGGVEKERPMKRLTLVCLALSFVAIWSVGALAAEDPWKELDKKDGDAAVVAPEPAPGGGLDLKKELPATLYQRTVVKIEAKLELAEKVMALYAKEMEKPEDKRNEKRAQGFKVQAAQFYLGANLEAKKAENAMTKPEHKAALAAQYEKPALEKAVALYLEFADKAFKDKDFKTAASYYQRVLQLDKENAAAKDGLERIKQQLQNQAEANKRGAGSGGKDENDRVWDPNRKDPARTGRDDEKDWTKTGREAGGWGR